MLLVEDDSADIRLTREAMKEDHALNHLHVADVTPFIGPVLMRVGGRGHAAAPCWAASKGVRPWRAECGLNVLYSQRQRSASS